MRYLFCILIGIAVGYGYIHYSQNSRSDSDDKVSLSGFAHYGKETLSSLKGTGLVTLEKTVIKGLLDVNGKVEAQGATIGSLEVNGAINLVDTKVSGKSRVNGFVSATNTTFDDEFNVASQKMIFNNCTVPSIVVRNISWLPGSQVIELNKKSKIAGNIVFESGDGKVILSDGSLIAGTVIGGEIEKK